MTNLQLEAGDWVMLILYLLACHLITIVVKLNTENNTPEDYFLGGRSMRWMIVGCGLFATNVGSHFFVGLAGSAAQSGIGMIAYEWLAGFILLFFGYSILPMYMGSGVYTVPQFIRLRYRSKRLGVYLAIVCIVSSFATKIANDVLGASLFLEQFRDERYNINFLSFLLLGFTGIYTLIGGLKSVIYTSAMQCVIIVIGSLTVSVISINKAGGWYEIFKKFPMVIGNYTNYTSSSPTPSFILLNSSSLAFFGSHNTTLTLYQGEIKSSVIPYNTGCYNVNKHWDHIFRPYDDLDLPWPGLIFSLPVTGIWYWCIGQAFVQQALGARSLLCAQRATVMTGFLKLLPFVLIVVPGMAARVLYPNSIACPNESSCLYQCKKKSGCAHLAYFKLLSDVGLPEGVVGLMFAMVLAAMMSSISMSFIAISTVFVLDVWKIIRPSSSHREDVWISRLAIILTVAFSVAWIPVVKGVDERLTFITLQRVQSYIAPSICTIFLMGIFSLRVTEVGAISTLVLGAILATLRFALDTKYQRPKCGEYDERPFLVRISFLYFSTIIFVLSLLCISVVSFFTKPVPRELLGKLTWTTMDIDRYDEENGPRNAIDGGNSELPDIPEESHCLGNISRSKLLREWIISGTLLVAIVGLFIAYR